MGLFAKIAERFARTIVVISGGQPTRLGGAESKSFYFFDFDDNVMCLATPIFLRNKLTGIDKAVSTAEFAKIKSLIGQPGEWLDFELYDRSFRNFDDIAPSDLRDGEKQPFIHDIEAAIAQPSEPGQHLNLWKAPAWPLLVYACRNQRPLAFLTARGHSRTTIRAGIKILVEQGLLEAEPNYLEIYAVGNEKTETELLNTVPDEAERERIRSSPQKIAILKRIAIRQLVEKGLQQYGALPAHRFGMSDDDPTNVSLIVKAMCDCKTKYVDKRFFVINTHQGEHVKLEVFPADMPVTGHAEAGDCVG